MKTTQNIILLKQNLIRLNIDYFLLPNSDEFNNEYLPEYNKRLEFITNFTGSNAFSIIGQKKSAFFTDGRYILQTKTEINNQIFEIFNLANKSPLKWLLEYTKTSKSSPKIGFDSKLHSINSIQEYQKHFGKNLIELDKNPIDKIWINRIQLQRSKVFKHSLKYCGLSSQEKIKNIVNTFDKNTDALILTNPTSICWLFNIRASDIKYSPLSLTFAIIHRNKETEFFHHNLPTTLNHNIKNIQTDFNQTNYWLYSILKKQKITITHKTDPCLIQKAIKNKIEIQNTIKIHQIDGLAVTKFLFWIQTSTQQIDEITATNKLLEFRQSNKKFLYPSFTTIAGFKSNGAIIHYNTNKRTNKIIQGNSLFLIDSGGQYKGGTTDITRTIAIGKPTKEMIENFTRVLKGHITLALAKFPQGTTGNNLDSLARYHLWQQELDYEHGTGHGVGSFSSVHESPPSISRNDNTILQEGMILSNEPGYYKTGKYGIRIENLMLITNTKNQFLQFQTISLAPLDFKLINFSMLTYPEKKWLKDYHQKVYDQLKYGLNNKEKNWLKTIVKRASNY